jgi:hypothetical protein
MPRPRYNSYNSNWNRNYNDYLANQLEKHNNVPNDPNARYVSIHVSLNPQLTPNFIEECIQGNSDKFTLSHLIFDFEEQELLDLKREMDYMNYHSNYTHAPPLYTMLKEIANELHVHIKLFVGHIESCEDDFLLPITARLDTIQEPTIIVIIACLGAQLARETNENEVWKTSQAVVMGFEDLVHIYNSEIYSCKLSHSSLPNMTCAYDSVEEDYKELVKIYGDRNAKSLNDYNVSQARHNDTNNLVQCCKAKLDRFRNTFLENFRKRKCVKHTKAKLLEKMRAILKADGTFDREKLIDPSFYTFRSADGVSCDTPSEDCEIAHPYGPSVNVAKRYNEMSSLLKLFDQFKNIAYAEKDTEEKDKETLKMLQGLKQTEMGILKYKDEDGTLLHVLARGGCATSILYLLKRKTDFDLFALNEEGDAFIEELSKSKFTAEEGLLRVLIKVLELEPDYFVGQSPERYDVLYHAVQKQMVSVVQYLAQYTTIDFAAKIFPDFYNYNLLFVSYRNLPWTTEKAYKLVKLLLAKGANPNHIADDDYDLLKDYFKIHPPLVREKILKELCYYGYSNVESIDDGISLFSKILNSPSEQIRYKQEILEEIKEWEENEHNQLKIQHQMFEEYNEVREVFLANFTQSMKTTIKSLEECKKIIERGGKKNSYRVHNKAKTLKTTKQNINNITRRLVAPDKIPIAYQNVNEYIKKVGAKFTKDEKKAYRNRGISVLQNKNTNVLERLQTLEDLLKEIMEESGKRGTGGRRTRKLRKN